MVTSPAPQPKSSAVTEIERLGFSYTNVAQYDLSSLDEDNSRVQVREVGHYAPKESVARFAVQMKEAQFPPVVVTQDGGIVDGNTRIKAARLNKQKFLPAIVLNVSWNGAPQKTQYTLEALAATLNANGGIQLTSAEARKVAVKLITLDWKTEQIGRALGLTASGVSQIRRELAAGARLRRVGLDPEQSVRDSALRALGSPTVLALNDVPFRELAVLAQDAGLRAREITDVAKVMKDAGSDEGAMSAVHTERVEQADRIREHQLTGNGQPPAPRMLRQHLGFITKYDGKAHELVEADPAYIGTYVAAMETAIKVLNAVLDQQR